MGLEKGVRENRSVTMAERRKSSKPIMEKRRRERINNSLNELKNLLLESRKNDSSCCSKLEKADILEMTVQHLKSLRKQQEKASSCNDPIALAHYRAGFNQSAAEISRYLINAQDIEVQVRTRLLTHLSNSCHAVLSGQPPVTHAQYHPAPTSPHFTSTTTKTPEVTSPVLNDPPSITFNSPEPYFLNPSQLQVMHMPTTLPNEKLAAVLVPSASIYPTTYHTSVRPLQLVPGPSSSPSGEDSVEPPKVSVTTSSQSPASSEDSIVWRPW